MGIADCARRLLCFRMNQSVGIALLVLCCAALVTTGDEVHALDKAEVLPTGGVVEQKADSPAGILSGMTLKEKAQLQKVLMKVVADVHKNGIDHDSLRSPTWRISRSSGR